METTQQERKISEANAKAFFLGLDATEGIIQSTPEHIWVASEGNKGFKQYDLQKERCEGRPWWQHKGYVVDWKLRWNGKDRWELCAFNEDHYARGDQLVSQTSEPSDVQFPPVEGWPEDTVLSYQDPVERVPREPAPEIPEITVSVRHISGNELLPNCKVSVDARVHAIANQVAESLNIKLNAAEPVRLLLEGKVLDQNALVGQVLEDGASLVAIIERSVPNVIEIKGLQYSGKFELQKKDTWERMQETTSARGSCFEGGNGRPWWKYAGTTGDGKLRWNGVDRWEIVWNDEDNYMAGDVRTSSQEKPGGDVDFDLPPKEGWTPEPRTKKPITLIYT